MSGFPKIKGLRWLSEDFPDLVAIDVTLEDRKIKDLGIEGMVIPETPGIMYVDLSKLAGVHDWYPKDHNDPSEIECSADFEGINNFIANVSTKDLLEAWIFYKRFKYARK